MNSPGTVAAAYRTLRERGLVTADGRRGTTVARQPAVRIRAARPLPGTVRDLASGNPDPALLPDLTALIGGMEAKALAGDEYGQTELDRAFHRRLFRTAGLPAVEPLLHRCILHNHRFKITRSGERVEPKGPRR